jgi:hypothetical protein
MGYILRGIISHYQKPGGMIQMDSLTMPIRAKPYTHQQEAFDLACRLFGVGVGGDAAPVSRGACFLMEMG